MHTRALVLFIIVVGTAGAARLPAQCSACRAVSAELEDRLKNERPRNHIDARHRLDNDGKRYGKLIEWRLSELRVIELLEGLCEAVSDSYELADRRGANAAGGGASAGDAQAWVRHDSLPAAARANPHLAKEQRKQLGVWCAALLEEEEERLSGALQRGALAAGGEGGGEGGDALEAFLCSAACGGGGDGVAREEL